ncbi:Serine/threonine-protein kinase SRPK [Pseudocercospora fuligena]|uniref:Serine/threonine-protein kinase SRPK n=1 Tax=Pseudocercospora fuligena TaxID=685502 RepID=A0A8H6RDE5_9PEZI|nr:Serine/threonine-protein kinase SRPK [Pseudocercospora fuligena]
MAAYLPLSIEPVEEIEDYRSGGFHPVHLGDIYDERVSARNVALKIIKASETENCSELKSLQLLSSIQSDHPGRAHVRSLLDHFEIEGPNGRHHCLVSEVAGPTLPSLYDAREMHQAARLQAALARRIARQFAQAVDFLYENGIDLTVPNILLKLKSIDSWTEDEIFERFGPPRKEELKASDGSSPGSSAPTYVVQAANVPAAQYLAPDIFLIDLGVSFPLETTMRPEDIGVPLMYQAPETMFDRVYDQFSELWSVGCVLFELRAGCPIFESFIGTKDDIIRQWVQMKGKMPEPWWSRWETRASAFGEDGNPLPRGPNDETWTTEYPLAEMIADIGEEDVVDDEADVETGEDYLELLLERPGKTIDEHEAQNLEDLLQKVFQWVPQDRLSVKHILEHSWFSSD